MRGHLYSIFKYSKILNNYINFYLFKISVIISGNVELKLNSLPYFKQI